MRTGVRWRGQKARHCMAQIKERGGKKLQSGNESEGAGGRGRVQCREVNCRRETVSQTTGEGDHVYLNSCIRALTYSLCTRLLADARPLVRWRSRAPQHAPGDASSKLRHVHSRRRRSRVRRPDGVLQQVRVRLSRRARYQDGDDWDGCGE